MKQRIACLMFIKKNSRINSCGREGRRQGWPHGEVTATRLRLTKGKFWSRGGPSGFCNGVRLTVIILLCRPVIGFRMPRKLAWRCLFGKTSNHPGDSAPYSPDLSPCDFWLFPKLNNLWKGRDFRPSVRFRKTQWGSWWRLEDLCEVPRYILWKGLRHHCPVYNVSFISYLLQ